MLPETIFGSQKFEQNAGGNRAKCVKNSGKKWRGKNNKNDSKKFGEIKFSGRAWKINNCIFKSIKLFENNSQELAQFYV